MSLELFMNDVITQPRMKICTQCNTFKPATREYFYRRKDMKDGFRSECRDCKNIQRRSYYQNSGGIAKTRAYMQNGGREKLHKNRHEKIETIQQSYEQHVTQYEGAVFSSCSRGQCAVVKAAGGGGHLQQELGFCQQRRSTSAVFLPLRVIQYYSNVRIGLLVGGSSERSVSSEQNRPAARRPRPQSAHRATAGPMLRAYVDRGLGAVPAWYR